jgi:hypothetical protein
MPFNRPYPLRNPRVRVATTGADGVFRFEALPAGSWTLDACDVRQRIDRTNVEVAAHETVEVELRLRDLGWLGALGG